MQLSYDLQDAEIAPGRPYFNGPPAVRMGVGGALPNRHNNRAPLEERIPRRLPIRKTETSRPRREALAQKRYLPLARQVELRTTDPPPRGGSRPSHPVVVAEVKPAGRRQEILRPADEGGGRGGWKRMAGVAIVDAFDNCAQSCCRWGPLRAPIYMRKQK